MTATQLDTHPGSQPRAIGPLGTTTRVLIGGLLLASVTWGHLTRGFHPSAWLLGLVGFPALLVSRPVAAGPPHPHPCLQATGPVAHALNVAVFVVLYLLEPTSDAALLFYGASIGWRRRGYAGCEVLAVSNWLLRRDDQIGYAVFWPIDQLEQHRTARRA